MVLEIRKIIFSKDHSFFVIFGYFFGNEKVLIFFFAKTG